MHFTVSAIKAATFTFILQPYLEPLHYIISWLVRMFTLLQLLNRYQKPLLDVAPTFFTYLKFPGAKAA